MLYCVQCLFFVCDDALIGYMHVPQCDEWMLFNQTKSINRLIGHGHVYISILQQSLVSVVVDWLFTIW